jgi:hypothetical protein
MKYLLSIYADESIWADASPEQAGEVMAAYQAFGRDAADVILAGDALQPTSTATTVRVRDGERLVTDGPFAETREQFGGYYLIDVPDLDTALAVAAKIPDAARGSIEVRPLMVFDDADAAAPDHDAAARA